MPVRQHAQHLPGTDTSELNALITDVTYNNCTFPVMTGKSRGAFKNIASRFKSIVLANTLPVSSMALFGDSLPFCVFDSGYQSAFYCSASVTKLICHRVAALSYFLIRGNWSIANKAKMLRLLLVAESRGVRTSSCHTDSNQFFSHLYPPLCNYSCHSTLPTSFPLLGSSPFLSIFTSFFFFLTVLLTADLSLVFHPLSSQ